MSQLKLQVLAIGELQSGKSTGANAREWHRRTLQIFTGEVAGQHPYYADKSELENMQAGYYMADLRAQGGERGRLEFVLGKLMPASKGNIPA